MSGIANPPFFLVASLLAQKPPQSLLRLLKAEVIFSSEAGPKMFVTRKQYIGFMTLSCSVCLGGGITLLSFIEEGQRKRGGQAKINSNSEQQMLLRAMLKDAKENDWRDNLDVAAAGMQQFMKPQGGGGRGG